MGDTCFGYGIAGHCWDCPIKTYRDGPHSAHADMVDRGEIPRPCAEVRDYNLRAIKYRRGKRAQKRRLAAMKK